MRVLRRETLARIDEARAGAPAAGVALLTALTAVQAERGQVGPEEIAWLAGHLGLTRAHVQGVARFYDRLSARHSGRHVIGVCEGISCHLCGSEALAEALCAHLGIAMGERTADGQYTLTRVACIGACDLAPALLVDDEALGPVAPEAVGSVVAALAREEGDDADSHR
jgi:NADH-quinone oxidoreductase subunit E